MREYFVRRFDELPDQARKVLDTIAQMPGPATPKEIAEASRLAPPLVNAQLKRLKEGHYVRPIKLRRQRSTCYDITERLFRIWRQTATVAGRQRFRFLADFLKLYFTPEEIRALYAHHAQYLRGTPEAPREDIVRHIEELFYFQAAGEGEIRYGALLTRVASLVRIGEFRWAEEEAQYFAAESLRRDDKPGVTAAYGIQVAIHLQTGRWEEALRCAEEAVALDTGIAPAWEQLGIAAGNLGHLERALEAFRKAAEVGKPTAALWTYQAVALNNLGRWEEALRCAEEAVALNAASAGGWEQ
ncbi:MAG: tetratricopeptide repeat protein, partial [Acidobacteriota bacterium]